MSIDEAARRRDVQHATQRRGARHDRGGVLLDQVEEAVFLGHQRPNPAQHGVRSTLVRSSYSGLPGLIVAAEPPRANPGIVGRHRAHSVDNRIEGVTGASAYPVFRTNCHRADGALTASRPMGSLFSSLMQVKGRYIEGVTPSRPTAMRTAVSLSPSRSAVTNALAPVRITVASAGS